MHIPLWSRLRLAPRIGLVIILTMLATVATEKLYEALVGPPDILVFERDWLIDTVVQAVDVASKTAQADRAEALSALPTAGWLDFTEITGQPITSHWEQSAFEAFHRDLSDRLALPPDAVQIRTGDTDGPDRALTPIVVILDGVPALITHILWHDDLKMVVEHLQLAVRLPNGNWLEIAPKSDGLEFARLVRNLLLPLTVVLLVAALSVWIARSVARPLTDLSAAAERLGREREPTPLGSYGSPELNAIASSFNDMQHRLKRFVDDRLQMVAAISHDLRTPLTRLRLVAEYLPDEAQRRQVLADIDEMEAIVSSTLSFASQQLRKEPAETVDLASLLISLCDTASDAGQAVTYDGPDHAHITCQPVAIRRAFANLIDNGCKYGQTVRVTLTEGPDAVRAVVSDDGPGIPADQVEAALRPFVRLEASRNRATGGSGLGLTITDEVIRTNRGGLAFAPVDPHGLAVTVTLPRSSLAAAPVQAAQAAFSGR